MFELTKKDRTHADAEVSSKDNHSDDNVVTLTEDISSKTENAHKQDIAVIGRSIRINGDLHGDEDVRVEGDVTGTIKLKKHTLTIGAEGKIHADVYAKAVTVDGLMEGDMYGSERVSIRKSAQVRGNITAPRVSLEDGARFKGSIEMDPKVAAAALGEDAAVDSKPAADEPANVAAKSKRVATSKTNGEQPAEKPSTTSDKGTETLGPLAG